MPTVVTSPVGCPRFSVSQAVSLGLVPVLVLYRRGVVMVGLHCSLACACGAAVGPFVRDYETERRDDDIPRRSIFQRLGAPVRPRQKKRRTVQITEEGMQIYTSYTSNINLPTIADQAETLNMEQHPTISSRRRDQARAWFDLVNVEMDLPPQNEGGAGAADIATTSNHPLDQSRSAENPNIRVPSLPNLEMVMQENQKLKAMLESLMQQLGMAAPPPPQQSPPLQPPQLTQQMQPIENPNSRHEETQEVHVTEQRHDAPQLNTSFEGTMVSQRAMIEQIFEAKMAEQNEGSATYDLYMVPYPVHHLFKRLPAEHPKVPKFSKFNGDGSPHEHIAHYMSIMGELATKESYLLRYFSTSLTGPAY
ncbi:hypothetical protein Taro_022877 [Colocasia esculenta]|uniref:Uncharacterized protein n=1 Tax=Colocasia esculenta TaxID=4460 RepID=A0A843V4X3_COLES|nr:hypothetical protein [Colocasia esculenta]